jgi:mannose-1-phosphate guanylyltransferase
MPVPALVLTAGLGTRMRPLSYVRAKPAMPVGGEALVRHILRRLAAAGVPRAVLNLHYLPETVTAAVGGGEDLGLPVRYSWENPVLGSAGGPRRALPLLGADRFLIVNGDTLTDADPRALLEAHARSQALVTLALIPNPDPARYGGVLVDKDGAITGFVPRGTPGDSWHFIGLQAAQAEAFAALSPEAPSESVGWLYPALMRERPGSIRAFRTKASFLDIGTPADYLATVRAWSPKVGGKGWIGRGCHVASSASVEGTVLWDDVTVGDDAQLAGCVVGDGVSIPPGARFTGQAIVPAEGRDAAAHEERLGDLLLGAIHAPGRP